ncbi:MAG: hypothetical protein ACKO3W_02175 [bacterium]
MAVAVDMSTMARNPIPAFASARTRWAVLSASLAIVTAMLGGCVKPMAQPIVLRAPYETERVWAVVPFANETGVSQVDGMAIADRFVAEIEGVEGLRCLPLNRSLAAMKSLGMTSVRDLQQAYTLMRTLQADGLVLGTVTDWDPYKPLRFGAAVEVISAGGTGPNRALDLNELTMPTAENPGGADTARAEISQASRILDGRSNETLIELERYAMGRADPDSALGSKAYEVRIDLFTRFGAWILTRDLLEQEAARLGVALPAGRAERAREEK